MEVLRCFGSKQDRGRWAKMDDGRSGYTVAWVPLVKNDVQSRVCRPIYQLESLMGILRNYNRHPRHEHEYGWYWNAAIVSIAQDHERLLLCRLANAPTDVPANRQSNKRRKPRAISTWSYTRARKPTEPEREFYRKIFYCKFDGCKYSGSITTNIRNHLKNHHGIHVSEEESLKVAMQKQRWQSLQQKAKEKAGNEAREKEEKTLKAFIKKPLVREALAELIVVRNLPYEAVTWPELKNLPNAVNYCAQGVIPKSAKTVENYVRRSYELILRQKLQSAVSRIHISRDVWSSPNRKSFLAIVAHFVDDTFKLRKALLALPFLPEKHGADDQINPL